MMESYPYVIGDRLRDRNTYFYTRFGGGEFLKSWTENRLRYLVAKPEPPPESQETIFVPIDSEHVTTAPLLEYLFHQIQVNAINARDTRIWLARLVGKFEVSKRIHKCYGAGFRASNIDAHRDLALYLRAAEVFESAYSQTEELQFLNVLLKIMDSLSSVFDDIETTLQGRFSWLIEREAIHVKNLAETKGVLW